MISDFDQGYRRSLRMAHTNIFSFKFIFFIQNLSSFSMTVHKNYMKHYIRISWTVIKELFIFEMLRIHMYYTYKNEWQMKMTSNSPNFLHTLQMFNYVFWIIQCTYRLQFNSVPEICSNIFSMVTAEAWIFSCGRLMFRLCHKWCNIRGERNKARPLSPPISSIRRCRSWQLQMWIFQMGCLVLQEDKILEIRSQLEKQPQMEHKYVTCTSHSLLEHAVAQR